MSTVSAISPVFPNMLALPPVPPSNRPGPFEPGFGLPIPPDVVANGPRTDEDISVDEWGMCGSVFEVNVGTGDGDDDIRLRINADGSSDLWVNGEYKGQFSPEQTEVLTIETGEGSDTVVMEDNRAFQDQRLPTVVNNGNSGTDSVEVKYPGYPLNPFPLQPGERSV